VSELAPTPLGCYDAYGDLANHVFLVNTSDYSTVFRCRAYWYTPSQRRPLPLRTWRILTARVGGSCSADAVLGAQAFGLADFASGTAVECSCFSAVPTTAALVSGAAPYGSCAVPCADAAAPLPCGRSEPPVRTAPHRHPTVVYSGTNMQYASACELACRSRYADGRGASGDT
jgi:hypothetical protein